ncbi:dGTPase [Pectobacterium carotovorum subsp. carotovorum]|uniref:dGTPase n=1 Tax=Pectobacterium carotovorum TaxID=554 RepID=UPI00201BC871|nr:dGTPase [Pectobacterium carotovorum]MCL6329054.1 dGTPase [Pectobacterium carotovorum subsp. carotovorum]
MKKIISIDRRRPSGAEHNSLLSATQSDRARLIYSAAFRRLQQKAQVFSLESNSSVRSRLTHSVEVSHIGRYIVAKIFEKLILCERINEEEKTYWREHNLAISNIVEIACLMHDIGNPPFGHFGESAIIEWSYSSDIKLAIKKSLGDTVDILSDELLSDFHYFDGNPQGLRVITRLQGEDGYYGLNLTYTQLASFLKYTYCPNTIDENKPFSKKIGYFSTERELIEDVWNNNKLPLHTRHPLGFLMEASDDISYCISDIEDGIEKKIITVNHFKHYTKGRLHSLKNNSSDEKQICEKLIYELGKKKRAPISNFLSFKTHLSNFLVDSTASKFVENYERIINLELDDVLISKDTFEYSLLKILKDYTSEFLFISDEAERMELSGFSIIKGILIEYTKLLSLTKEKFTYLLIGSNDKISKNNLHIERRLFNRLPKKHVNAYKTSILNIATNHKCFTDDNLSNCLKDVCPKTEWNIRAHLIVDFVSGMTDLYSMDMYQLLKGIKVK